MARIGTKRLQRGLCDVFRGHWALPQQHIPWALPFAISKEEAHTAFTRWSASHSDAVSKTVPRPKVTAIRPHWLPYYVFEGELEVGFTGVVGYEKTSSSAEFALQGLSCPRLRLGAASGPTMAVYAGFDFRRIFVRQALSGDLNDSLLQEAVPLTQLQQSVEHGHGVEAFKMKPSFAFIEHIMERLSILAHHEAELHLASEEASELTFRSLSGQSVRPATDPRSVEYLRVEEVQCSLEDAKLHDRGVVMLPLHAIEYTFIGRPFRAFVSALKPGPHPTVAGMRHSADAMWAADDGRVWRAIGDMRRSESASNQEWKVRRFWLNEVNRVLRYEVPRPKSRLNFGQRRQDGTLAGSADSCEPVDYQLLGLAMAPPPTEACVAAAFRAQAMKWHPDVASPENRAECKEHFQRIVKAHSKLRLEAKARRRAQRPRPA